MSFKLLISVFLIVISVNEAQVENQVYKHPGWSYNKSIYEANVRQFSPEGTFKKFQEYISELKEMGIGIIWFMPVHPIGELNRKGTLGSYYSVKDYYGINSEFGTKEDFRELVNEIHKNGMYVILDWVANHTSWDNPLTFEHPEFFIRDSAGNFIPPNEDWDDVIDLNYENPELHKYMIDAMSYWIKEFDVDGFRCDVAEMVPMQFWNAARVELEKIKPVFMLAEGEQSYLHEAFDMTYSWETLTLMKGIASGEKSISDFHKYILEEKNRYPMNAFRMRFITNHDENSWNATEYEIFENGAEAFGVLTTVIPGMPLIYTGQETGSQKRLPFFEKDTIEWNNDKLREVYSNLLNMKKEDSVLFNGEAGGDYIPVQIQDSVKILSFIRSRGGDQIFCIFNLSDETKNVGGRGELLKGPKIFLTKKIFPLTTSSNSNSPLMNIKYSKNSKFRSLEVPKF